MADVRLPTDIQNLRPISVPASSVIINAADAVQKLAVGQVILAQVIGRNTKGYTELSTPYGTIQIQTTQPLIPGRAVNITVQQNGAQPQIQLQIPAAETQTGKGETISDSIRALLPQLIPPNLPKSAEQPIVPSGGNKSAAIFLEILPDITTSPNLHSQETILPGKVIGFLNDRIQVLTSYGTIPVPAGKPLPEGAEVHVQISRDGKKPNVIIPQDPQSLKGDASVKAYVHSAATQTVKPQNVTVTIVQYTPTTQQVPQNTPASPQSINKTAPQFTPAAGKIPIHAEVIHVNDRNMATLKLAAGIVTLQTPYRMNIGDNLSIILDPVESFLAAAAESAASPLVPIGGKTIPSLQQLIDLWRTQTNMPLSQFVKTALPNVGERFAPQAILYLASVIAGSGKFWLGPKLQKELDKEKSGIGEKISEDFTAMQKSGVESESQIWRHIPLPLFDGQKLHYAQMYFKNNHSDGEENQGQRFIIEADLSRLGTMQMDGFIRDQNFNLMVRSHTRLPDNIQQDIRDIFQDYMELSGWNGQINFQNMPNFPVKPAIENQDIGGIRTIATDI